MNKIANLLWDLNKKNVKSSKNFNPSKIEDVLILTDRVLPDDVFKMFPEATVLFYSDTNDLPRRAIPLYKSDFSYLGKIKSHQIKDLLDKNYDLFIENHTEESPFMDYLYRHINANCNISYRPHKWVDILVKGKPQNSKEYFEDINTILKKFQENL